MALNFPNSPVNGTTYTAPSGVEYRYDGEKWITVGSQNATVDLPATYVAVAGDTMTGQLTLPGGGTGSQAATVDQVNAVQAASLPLTGGALTGDLSTTGDVQIASLNSGPLAGFRNLLINGDFRIWQRAITGSGNYLADRWRMSGGVGNTYNRLVNDADLAALGFDFGLKNDGPNLTIFGQYIELTRKGRTCQFPIGSQWTWSVWSTAAPTNTLIRWSRDDNAANETAATPVAWTAIATQGSWTRYQQTFTISAAPTDTQMTSLLVRFNLANGQSVAGCQLEMGPVATPFEMRPIGTELALCQRYFQSFPESIVAPVTRNDTGTTGIKRISILRPVPMRTSPTEAASVLSSALTLQGNANYIDATTASGASLSTNTALGGYTADAEL